jgi:hypothetical protein
MIRLIACRTLAIAALSMAAVANAGAQSPTNGPPSPWSVTLDVGAFVQGNRTAITNWLRRNAYGTTEPKRCGFTLHLESVCDAPVSYPQVSNSGIIGGLAIIRRKISTRTAIEVGAATEQSGVATGRCNNQASPKDARCTDTFLELEFGGASVAMLAVVTTRHVQLGAGPALLLANWRMQPAHLGGMWFDATAERDPWPFFLRAQYRVYRPASFAPEQRFSSFHPSTLFMGLGFKFRPNN